MVPKPEALIGCKTDLYIFMLSNDDIKFGFVNVKMLFNRKLSFTNAITVCGPSECGTKLIFVRVNRCNVSFSLRMSYWLNLTRIVTSASHTAVSRRSVAPVTSGRHLTITAGQKRLSALLCYSDDTCSVRTRE